MLIAINLIAFLSGLAVLVLLGLVLKDYPKVIVTGYLLIQVALFLYCIDTLVISPETGFILNENWRAFFSNIKYSFHGSLIFLFPFFFHLLFNIRGILPRNIILGFTALASFTFPAAALIFHFSPETIHTGSYIQLGLFTVSFIYCDILVGKNIRSYSQFKIRLLLVLFIILISMHLTGILLQNILIDMGVLPGFFVNEVWFNPILYTGWNLVFLWFIMDYIEVKPIPVPGVDKKIPILINRFGISPREAEIIAYLIQGYSNNEIGKRLFISGFTVKTHVQNVYQKLKISNRVELANLFKSDPALFERETRGKA
ncbi:MAG: hypothetical protein A2Y33_02615 [Spirochaetes bacterium GWF1_51_8]|nr:MAG: hypothetical protein A2Y33_02615 [Spirochaetes bacterium GWF1_51_8]